MIYIRKCFVSVRLLVVPLILKRCSRGVSHARFTARHTIAKSLVFCTSSLTSHRSFDTRTMYLTKFQVALRFCFRLVTRALGVGFGF